MYRTARLTAIAALGLLLSACHTAHTVASGPTGHGAPAGDAKAGTIVTGPGPQSHYTVQPQPAPGSCHYGSDDDGQPLPDASCTPGAISPAVTQATIGSTICRQGGYTATIRPPASITDAEKRANAKSYAYTGSLHDAEYDHLISLELGGDPNDPRNLWVEPPSPGHQPGAGPNNPKDVVESKLHTAVCSGQTSLSAAQQAIAANWPNALSKLGLS